MTALHMLNEKRNSNVDGIELKEVRVKNHQTFLYVLKYDKICSSDNRGQHAFSFLGKGGLGLNS